VRAETHDVLSWIAERLSSPGGATTVYFANAHSLNLTCRDPAFRRVMREGDLVLNDGAGLAIAGHLRRRRFPRNLNGSDLSPLVLELAAAAGSSVFFLGAKPGVAERAAERLTGQIEGLVVAGCRDGYFSPAQTDEVVDSIRASGADLLLVAMGNPRQELWLADHLESTGARVGIGVGAFLDFASRNVPRAPRWANRLGVEWVWRLAHEPRRLAKRYLVGNPLFLTRVLIEAIRLSRSGKLAK
jgi:exopolysaccharide biosynthesis WecB/TagA/CpsF family protein